MQWIHDYIIWISGGIASAFYLLVREVITGHKKIEVLEKENAHIRELLLDMKTSITRIEDHLMKDKR